MFNTRGYLRTCLLLLLVVLLALPWQSATARWPDPPPVGGAPYADDVLADVVPFRGYSPAGQVGMANSLATVDRDQGPHLWRPLKTRPVPRVLFQPLKEETKLPDQLASTCEVISTSDSGPGTLRQCLLGAVAGDDILFDTTTFPPGTPMTITLVSELPLIAVDNLTIDASNSWVILDGSALTEDPAGLVITGAEGVTIRGMQILNFFVGVLLRSGAAYNTVGGNRAIGTGPLGQGNLISGNTQAGIQLQESGTEHNSIIGNFIGTDISGNSADSNDLAGVLIVAGASQNVIGGARSPGVCDGPCNLISGNINSGVLIAEDATTGNQVLGNFVGTNINGGAALPNDLGVQIGWSASDTQVGGPGAGEGNLISGNVDSGVVILDDGTTGNQVLGNFIGTDNSGDNAIGNGYAGIVIAFGASQNFIGGAHSPGVCDGPCNLIGGNVYRGVQVQNTGTTGNQVLGNFIGTDISGGNANGNGYAGVVIASEASQNVIGGAHSSGTCDGPCNLVSSNFVGVQIQNAGTEGNQVLGNFVGTNAAGDAALPNNQGVEISQGASDTQVGGAGAGEGNLISGNGDNGVFILDEFGDGTTGNQLLGNFVGTNASGDAALPNNYGVAIGLGATYTLVGGAGSGEGNLISGNSNIGVWIDSAGTTGNQVLGNIIGTDISGSTAVPNYHGIIISTGSTGNRIGDAASGGGNLISGNLDVGIFMQSLAAPGNTIAGNKIGTDLTGTVAVPNYLGILLDRASDNLIGGTEPGAGNLISGNLEYGMSIENSILNSVQGNTIGTDVTGEVAIPNVFLGILIIFGSSNNTIGGSAPGAGNLISGNGTVGVVVQDEASVGNRILGNRIGTNRNGTSSLPNKVGVLISAALETIIGGEDTSTPWVCDGPCNLISGNDNYGVSIQGVSADTLGQPSLGVTARLLLADQANQVLGNFIGTDLTGTSALPNLAGVALSYEATGNLIGGNGLSGEGNLISGNQLDGIVVRHPLTSNNHISGNRIGTTADGEAALANGRHGVWITEGASGNTVGGDGAGLGNLISGQATDLLYFGVSIDTPSEPEAIDNQVIGNLIGTNWAGTSAIPNGGGVGVAYLVTGTIIRDNVISGNSLRGILIMESTGNQVRDNNIGVAADGLSPLPNFGGIVAATAPINTLGPGNIIAYNQVGVAIVFPESVGVTITQNSIYANTDEQIVFYEVPQPLAPAPILTGWDESTVSGTACAGCQVEVFANPGPRPAGRTYLGTTTAAGDGTFSLTIGPGYIYLAATATDAEGTTSELSTSLLVGTIFFVNLPVIVKTAGALH